MIILSFLLFYYLKMNNTYTYQLILGEDYNIVKTGNITTGYEWQYTLEPITGDMKVTSVYSSNTNFSKSSTYVGAPGIWTFNLLPTKIGTVKLTLTYKRPWLTTSSSTDIYLFNIIQ